MIFLLFYDRIQLRGIGDKTISQPPKADRFSEIAFLGGAGLILAGIPIYVIIWQSNWYAITVIAAGTLLMISGAVRRLWLAIKGRSS